MPHLLEGLGGKRELFQPDGIHPTEAAQARIMEQVWAGLRALLR